jgi:hypothetical protein
MSKQLGARMTIGPLPMGEQATAESKRHPRPGTAQPAQIFEQFAGDRTGNVADAAGF